MGPHNGRVNEIRRGVRARLRRAGRQRSGMNVVVAVVLVVIGCGVITALIVAGIVLDARASRGRRRGADAGKDDVLPSKPRRSA